MAPDIEEHRTGFSMPDDGCGGSREAAVAYVQRCVVANEGMQAQWRRGLTVNAHERLALVNLWLAGPMPMTELGERIPLSRAAVTSLVDRLERLGYLVRSRDDRDRRRTVLRLTERSFEVVRPLWRPYAEQVDELARRYDDDQWETICGFLERLTEISRGETERLRAMDDDELHEIVDEGQRAMRLGA